MKEVEQGVGAFGPSSDSQIQQPIETEMELRQDRKSFTRRVEGQESCHQEKEGHTKVNWENKT